MATPPGSDPRQHPPQPQPMHVAQPLPYPQNGMAIAGLVLGIIATVIAIIPFGILFIWPASVLAIVFGAIGHHKASTGWCTMKREAVVGWILGIVSMVAAPFVWLVLFAGMVGSLGVH